MNRNHKISREYFLNADFDIALGDIERPSSAMQNFIEELSIHYIFAGLPVDSVIVYPELPSEYFNGSSAESVGKNS